MPEYRRAKIAGGTFFFMVATFNRKPILISDTARNYLWCVLMRCPSETGAIFQKWRNNCEVVPPLADLPHEVG